MPRATDSDISPRTARDIDGKPRSDVVIRWHRRMSIVDSHSSLRILGLSMAGGRTLHSRGPGPNQTIQNPMCLRIRILVLSRELGNEPPIEIPLDPFPHSLLSTSQSTFLKLQMTGGARSAVARRPVFVRGHRVVEWFGGCWWHSVWWVLRGSRVTGCYGFCQMLAFSGVGGTAAGHGILADLPEFCQTNSLTVRLQKTTWIAKVACLKGKL